MILTGKWLYFALAGLLGMIFALENNFLYVIVFCAFFFLFIILKKFDNRLCFVTIAVFCLFFLRGELVQKDNQTFLSGKETEFLVELKQPIKVNGNLFTAHGQDLKRKEKLVIRYLISSPEEKETLKKLSPGTICHIEGKLEKVRSAGNQNAFNYQKYLEHRGIFWTAKADQLVITRNESAFRPIIFIQNLRQQGIFYIYEHFPKETAPLAAALVFGERTEMDTDLLDAYKSLGIVHLLAISGLHVSMLTGLLFYFMLRLNITREKATDLLIIFLPLYSLLTGASPSVLRACAMTMIVLVLVRIGADFKRVPVDVISIVFFLYIFITPYVIYDVGFQLSFLVTASLILSSPFLRKYQFRPLALLLSTSFVAQLASVPIMLYHFYEFSFFGIFANILYVPFFSMFVLPAVLIFFILHFIFGFLVNPFLLFFDCVLSIVNSLTKEWADLPFSTLTLGRPSSLFMGFYLIVIPYTFALMEEVKSWKNGLKVLLIPVMLMIIHHAVMSYSPKGEVTMIDVGQGDSILIKLPFNQGTYLIDTGGVLPFDTEEWKSRKEPFDPGEDIVVPFLKSKGVTKLDKLILTHGDSDHIGGAPALIEMLWVDEVVLPKVEKRTEFEQELISRCKEKRIPVRFASRGDRWSVGGSEFFILSSGLPNANRNDQSIVLFARLGGLDWLFTGDLEERGESLLMAHYPYLSADVLKVGHHGSASSSTESFLDAVKPQIAFISAGRNNRFGHPNEEVIERLEKRGIRIFRTDVHGAVSYYFTQKRGTFSVRFHTIVSKE